jgi:hypothetical protein
MQYQLAIPAPKPPAGNFDPAAATRGQAVFEGKANCDSCHVPPLFTEPGWNLHDPVVTLFDAAGTLIAEDDDGSAVADAVTGESLDAFLQIGIPAGVYFAALTQSPNFAIGPTLADGFELAGTGDFTGGFMDVFGNQRDSRWAMDIRNVAFAGVFPTAVPEPGTVWLLGFVLLLVALRITPQRSCAWLRCASIARAPASRAR